jgi:urease subunit gamma/beta
VRLTQTELDRVLVFTVAEMARKRRAAGLKLNHPEAVGLLTDEMMELARAGATHEEVRAFGLGLLSADDVMPGVPELMRGMSLECLFEDGPRIIVLASPIADATSAEPPGEITLLDDPIELNVGREPIAVSVRNDSDHVVNVSSHYHFYEVNPRLEFDRPPTYGRRLDIQAGRSVIWRPDETKTVGLIPYAGLRRVEGFQLTLPPTAARDGTSA